MGLGGDLQPLGDLAVPFLSAPGTGCSLYQGRKCNLSPLAHYFHLPG